MALCFVSEMPNPHIVIFDGVCNFCNEAVNFIIKRDPRGVFAFAPMQSRCGQSLIQKYNIPEVGIDTLLLIKNGRSYLRTDAALEITKDLSGLWFFLRALKIVPRPLRGYFYKVFARNRYKLFGKRDTCMIPAPEVRSRFINDET